MVGRAETVCSIFYLFAIFCYRKATSEQSKSLHGYLMQLSIIILDKVAALHLVYTAS